MMKKIYYKIEFVLKSALAIGSGENDTTDKDIIKNGLGVPYIPGTSLAGIYRALFDEGIQKHYFGKIDGKDADNSKVIVYDAKLVSTEYRIGKRDCVSLDEYKTAIKGSKFDFEILEPGVMFVTYIEQEKSEDDEDIAGVIAKAWSEGRISIGSKTERGLGQIKVQGIKCAEFDLDTKADQWLEFDVFDDVCWEKSGSDRTFIDSEDVVPTKAEEAVSIQLGLRQDGPISIRVYTTDISSSDLNPDYKQLTYTRGSSDIPVIPGTSWAGCFLHNMKKMGYRNEDNIFGSTEAKSAIYFSESEISGAKGKIITRNAIDRFTGGCVDNALFTEKMYYGGRTSLTIKIKKRCTDEFYKMLAASIVDLHMGFMAVGGETSVGHGVFKLEDIMINGKAIKGWENDVYNSIVSALAV